MENSEMASEPMEGMGEAMPAPAAASTPDTTASDEVNKIIKAKVDDCRRVKRDMIPDWAESIDQRRGKSSNADSDENRSSVTVDWAQTKTKQAQLYSVTPQIVVTAEQGADSPYKPAFPVFQRRLNKRIKDAKVSVAMDEVVPDMVNASGFGAVLVSYEARTENRPVPRFDPNKLTMMQKIQQLAGMFENPMIDQPFVTDRRFTAKRVSPTDVIWDTSFTGSDFDDCSLIGHEGRLSGWAEAKRRFSLDDSVKDKVCGDDRPDAERLASKDSKRRDDNAVPYQEIFYWRYRYYPEEPSFKAIHHLVYLNGIDKPVVDEPWKGQKSDGQGGYLGACRFPIQVGTLTYLSDEAIPPSDSAIGRAAVKELMEYREDQKEQRKYSIPARWFDVNRLAPEVQTNLMQGTNQGMIPVNGDGSRVIGEVARASYPRDSRETELSLRQDLQESWRIGPNQMGALAKSGEHSATESANAQMNYATGIGYERNRTVKLLLGVVEVLAGLMVLYDDFDTTQGLSEGDKQKLKSLDLRRINHEAVLSIRADSTVLIDSAQRFNQLDNFVNKTAKSGFLAPKSIIEEMASLVQLDPSVVVVDPIPSKPEQPNVSFRFSGEDMMNPIVLAILAKNNMAPTVEELAAVYKLQKAAGLPASLVTSDAQDPVADPPNNTPDNPFPKWNTLDTIEKRSAERGMR